MKHLAFVLNPETNELEPTDYRGSALQWGDGADSRRLGCHRVIGRGQIEGVAGFYVYALTGAQACDAIRRKYG